MARPIQEPLPSSSLARLLDSAAAGRATALRTPAVAAPPALPAGTAVPDGEPATPQRTRPIKREVLLNRETDAALDLLIQLFRESSGARLTASHIVRALLRTAQAAVPQIRQAAQQLGPQPLPSNAPAHENARRRFEQRIVEALGRGIRMASPRKD